MMNQQSEVNNGLIAAAMLAAGIGCLFLGIITTLSEGIHSGRKCFKLVQSGRGLDRQNYSSPCALVGLLGHTCQ